MLLSNVLLGLQDKEEPMGRMKKKTGKGGADSEESVVPNAWEETVLRISGHQKNKKQQVLARMWKQRKTCALLVGL